MYDDEGLDEGVVADLEVDDDEVELYIARRMIYNELITLLFEVDELVHVANI